MAMLIFEIGQRQFVDADMRRSGNRPERSVLLKQKQKLMVALGSTLLGLLLCEAIARVIYPAPPSVGREPQLLYVSDPELGFFHQPNQRGWLDDGLVTINSWGFRGREVESPKPRGTFRIAVLGDSIAVGWGVADGETFSAHLERALRVPGAARVEVVNCAVSGYDTKQEAALFTRFASRLQPDLVLVAFYWNDILPMYVRAEGRRVDGSTQIVAKHPEPGQTLRLHQQDSSRLDRVLRWSRAFYHVGRTVRWLTTRPKARDGGQFLTEQTVLDGRDTAAVTSAWTDIEAQLRRIASLCQEPACRFGIVVLPGREQVTNDYPHARYQTQVREIGQRLGFFVIDPLPRFLENRASVNSLYIPYDRHHPTAMGHRLVAETIRDYLAGRSELLSAPSANGGQ